VELASRRQVVSRAGLARHARKLRRRIAPQPRARCELAGSLTLLAVDLHLEGDDRTLEQGDALVVHVTTPQRFGIALAATRQHDLDAMSVRPTRS
jgi:hypothetical protein